jgi:uncharacterized protein
MQFNVAQLLKAPIGTSRAFDVAADFGLIEENPTTRPVTGSVRVTKTKRGVLIDARLKTAVVLQCGRCLEEGETPIDVHIQEEFLPTIDLATGLVVTLDQEDSEAFRVGEDHILDLEEPLRQYALLAMPLKPLCQPDCRGLCPSCGRNLNIGACDCRSEQADNPLAPLASLLQQLAPKE